MIDPRLCARPVAQALVAPLTRLPAAAAFAAACALLPAAWAQPVVDAAHCHAYEAIDQHMTWEQARTAAAARTFGSLHGHLATITSQEETDFVLAAFGPRDSFALGGVQTGGPEPAGGWQWITGEPWVYTNWNTGEPNNAVVDGEFEDRLAWFGGNAPRWNDVAGNIYQGDGAGEYRMNGYFVEYDILGPTVTQEPMSAIVCPGGLGEFSVAATGSGTFTYQWQIKTTLGQWVSIGDDPVPLPCGNTIGFGSRTATLHLGIAGCSGATPVRHDVRCLINDSCGGISSGAATLTLCAADFDCDGAADFFDYDAFVHCFEGTLCPPGKTADFDGDGTVDFFDYDAFVVAFETGC